MSSSDSPTCAVGWLSDVKDEATGEVKCTIVKTCVLDPDHDGDHKATDGETHPKDQ